MNILALGHFNDYQYHPFGEVAGKLQSIAAGAGYEIRCTGDPGELESSNLNHYDLIISYADAWEQSLTPQQMADLEQFVAMGKGLLAIHCGISYANPEYFQLIGAKFIEHPPFQRLSIHIKDLHHPITAGINDFETEDELYMFEFAESVQVNILMECPFEGKNYPFAWTRDFGRGKVVYLAPGHQADGFAHDTYIKVIQNSLGWITGK
jgi:type 1 glutamine amidotransferase